MKRIIIIVSFCMCFLSGCRSWQREIQATVMAEAKIAFGQYQDYSIQLIMKNGQYYTEEEAVPSVGVYEENYEGEYTLQVSDTNGKIIATMSLNADWGQESINFPGKFELCVGDYNKDGFPDFTIGTAGSSSVNLFRLYSLDYNGKIIKIGEFTDTDKTFSICLEQEEGETDFYTTEWNNAIGEAERVEWVWSEENRYIRK